MRQLLLIIILIGAALGATAQNLRFDKTSHNFGTIEESGGKVSHTFSYTNTTDSPIVVVDVAVSCGCTTPRFSREPLAPGATAQMTIEFDPINRPGRINKKIHVVTNDSNTELTIDGIVNPRPRSLAERYPFIISRGIRIDGLGHFALQVPIGRDLSCQIGVANGGSGVPATVAIDKEKLPTNVRASVSDKLLAAGEEAKIIITVRGDKYGAFSYKIPLLINGQQTAENITVSGAVIDDFEALTHDELMSCARAKFSTFYHRFGSVQAGSRQNAVIDVTNVGQVPLIVRGIESSAQIEAKIDRTTIPPGSSAKLTLTYCGKQSGYDSGSIKLTLNDPRNPTPEIRFVATVE